MQSCTVWLLWEITIKHLFISLFLLRQYLQSSLKTLRETSWNNMNLQYGGAPAQWRCSRTLIRRHFHTVHELSRKQVRYLLFSSFLLLMTFFFYFTYKNTMKRFKYIKKYEQNISIKKGNNDLDSTRNS